MRKIGLTLLTLSIIVILTGVVFGFGPGLNEPNPEDQEVPPTHCKINHEVGSLFPPSPITPKLPPPNKKPYQNPNHVCRHFADEFCDAAKNISEIKRCEYYIFDEHAINLILYENSSGEEWICVVEPQSNEYLCMTDDEWNSLDFDYWTIETLCKGDYNIKSSLCEKYRPNVYSYCKDREGEPCSADDAKLKCRTDNDDYKELTCNCQWFYGKCTWEDKKFEYPYLEHPLI